MTKQEFITRLEITEKQYDFYRALVAHLEGALTFKKKDITAAYKKVQHVFFKKDYDWLMKATERRITDVFVITSTGSTRKSYTYTAIQIDDMEPYVFTESKKLQDIAKEQQQEMQQDTPKVAYNATVQKMNSIHEEVDFIPEVSDEYVPFGFFNDAVKIVKSNMFYPVYITGLSGNGKTYMVEQACAKSGRELFRVNITVETDEDDLLGGFRLIDGETVWHDGPVVTAMRRGAVLLLDEIDLASNKIMCLQPVLEGKGIYLKKINEFVKPAQGFTAFATANTKGRGSEDGRFVGTNVLNEAFLERFDITVEQEYAPSASEKKILAKHTDDQEFINNLVLWANVIRKSFREGVVDDIVTTRRLVKIVKSNAIFQNRTKAIDLCLSRFDAEVKEAFFDLYSKVDSKIITEEVEERVAV